MTKREGPAADQENGAAGSAAGPIEGGGGRRVIGRRGAPQADRPPTSSASAVHIDDRASQVFVIGVAVVFVLIFLNALLLGQGGLLTPLLTPPATPPAVVTPAPGATPTPIPTPTP
jgi:hypothetical protein